MTRPLFAFILLERRSECWQFDFFFSFHSHLTVVPVFCFRLFWIVSIWVLMHHGNWPQHFKAFCLRILHYRGQICAFTINVFICCVNSRLCVFPPQLWKTVAFSWWTSQTMSCGCHCLMSRCQTRVDMFASSTRIPRRRPTLTSLC